MSFLRSLFVATPAETDAEYAASLIEKVLSQRDVDFAVAQLKDLAATCGREIAERGIPALLGVLKSGASDETVSNVYFIINELVKPGCEWQTSAAEQILAQSGAMGALVDAMESRNEKKRAATMRIITEIGKLAPVEMRKALTEDEATFIRLLSFVVDENEEVALCLVSALPVIMGDDADFKSVVAFYGLDRVAAKIGETKYLEFVECVLDGNPVGQNMFVSGGHLGGLSTLVRGGSEGAVHVVEILREARNFDEAVSQTDLVGALVHALLEFQSPRVEGLLIGLIKGSSVNSKCVTAKLGQLITRYVSDDSFPLIDVLAAYLYESEDNGVSLARVIVDMNDWSGAVIDVATLCVLEVGRSKEVLGDFFDTVLSRVDMSDFSGLRFIVTMVWNSQESCAKVRQCGIMKRLVSVFVGGSVIKEDVLPLVYFLLAEIALLGPSKVSEDDVLATYVQMGKLREELGRIQINERSRFGKLQLLIRKQFEARMSCEVVNEGVDECVKDELVRLKVELHNVNEKLVSVQGERLVLQEKLSEHTRQLEEVRSENLRLVQQKEEIGLELQELKEREQTIVSELEEKGREVVNLSHEIENRETKEIADLTAKIKSSESEQAKLEVKNAHLEDKLQAALKQLEDLRAEQARLIEENKTCSANIEEMTKREALMKKDLENKTQEVLGLSQKYTAQELNETELTRNLGSVNEKLKALELEKANIEATNGQLQEQLRVTSKQLDELKNEQRRLIHKNEEVSVQLQQKHERESALKTQLDTKNEEAKALSAKITDLQAETQTLKNKLSVKEQTVEKLELEIESFKAVMETKGSAEKELALLTADFNEKMKSVEAAKAEAEARSSSLQMQLDQCAKQLESLKQDNMRVVRESESQIQKMKEREHTIQGELDSKSKEIVSLSARVTDLEQLNGTMKKKLDEKDQSIKRLQADITNFTSAAEGQSQEVVRLSREIENLETKRSVEDKMAALTTDFNEKIKSLETAKAAIEAKNLSLQKKLKQLTKLLDNVKQDNLRVVQGMESQLQKMKERECTMQGNLDAKSKEVTSLLAKVTELEKLNETLKDDLAQKSLTVDQLSTEIETCKSAAKDDQEELLKRMCATKDAAIKSLQTELAACKKDLRRQKATTKSLQAEKQQLSESMDTLEQLSARTRQLELTNQKLRKQLDALNLEMKKQEAKQRGKVVLTNVHVILDLPASNTSKLDHEKQMNLCTIEALKQQLSESQVAASELETELDFTKKNMSMIQARNKDLEAKVKTLEHNINDQEEARTELSELKEVVQTLHEKSKLQKHALTDLALEKEKLENQLNADKAKPHQQIEELKRERAVMRTTHMAEVASLEAKIKVLKQRNLELIELAQGDKTVVDELNEIIAALKSEIAIMKDENVKLVKYVQAMRKEKPKSQQYEKELSGLREENNKLLRENAELSAEIRFMNESFCSQSREIGDFKSDDDETEHLRRKNEKLKSKLKKARKRSISRFHATRTEIVPEASTFPLIREDDHKKALRLIGRMWLSKHYQLNT